LKGRGNKGKGSALKRLKRHKSARTS